MRRQFWNDLILDTDWTVEIFRKMAYKRLFLRIWVYFKSFNRNGILIYSALHIFRSYIHETESLDDQVKNEKDLTHAEWVELHIRITSMLRSQSRSGKNMDHECLTCALTKCDTKMWFVKCCSLEWYRSQSNRTLFTNAISSGSQTYLRKLHLSHIAVKWLSSNRFQRTHWIPSFKPLFFNLGKMVL